MTAVSVGSIQSDIYKDRCPCYVIAVVATDFVVVVLYLSLIHI